MVDRPLPDAWRSPLPRCHESSQGAATGGFAALMGWAGTTNPIGRRLIFMSQRRRPRIAPETHSHLYTPTGAVEVASLCLNVMRFILPVRLRRIGLRNHCLSPSFLCCPRRQPWQMIRQKGDRRIGLVSAQARTTKYAIDLKNSASRPSNSRPPSGRSGTRRKRSRRS
jgi:hypothetical protein